MLLYQMEGKVIRLKMKEDGLYDGVIQTSNGNNYYFFNLSNKNLILNTNVSFDMSKTERTDIDFEAINLNILF